MVGHVSSGRAGADGVREDMGIDEGEILHMAASVFKLGVGFAGKCDDKVGAECDMWDFAAQVRNILLDLSGGVEAVHSGKDGITSAL